MDVFTIIFIFMITTSITLVGFVIRQRKNNRMLGEVVAQSKVDNAQRDSNVGIGVQNQAYVSRCPACAEWINLEAKVCKSCQNDVMSHNLSLKKEMKKIDIDISEADLARKSLEKAQRDALVKSPIFKGLCWFILIFVIILVGLRVPSTFSYYKATGTPSSALELAKSWNSIIEECQFSTLTQSFNPSKNQPEAKVKVYPSFTATVEEDRYVELWIRLEGDYLLPNSPIGQKVLCFSKNALGIDAIKKFDGKKEFSINFRNNFSAYLYFNDYYGEDYIEFNWNYSNQ